MYYEILGKVSLVPADDPLKKFSVKFSCRQDRTDKKIFEKVLGY